MMTANAGRLLFSKFQEDEDLLDGIQRRAEEASVKAASFTLIGAVKNVSMGLYKAGEYKMIKRTGPFEIASCTGNVAEGEKGGVMIHAHIVVSNENGEAFGGHLMKQTHVGPTAEIVFIEASDAHLVRAFDPKTKLNLLRLG